MQYNHIRSPLIGGSKRSRVMSPAEYRLFISQRLPKKKRRNDDDDLFDPRPPPQRPPQQQQKIDKRLWECVRPYDPDTATIKDRWNSCEKTENGTFKNRTLCYEDCYYKNKKKKSEDEMRKVRKVAKNFMAHQGSKRARGMAGMR